MRERRHPITVVNRTEDVEKRAAKTAQDDLREEQHAPIGKKKWKPKKLKHMAMKLAMHFGEEYFRQRGIKRAREAILDTNNVNVAVDTINNRIVLGYKDKTQSRTAGKAKIEQVRLPDPIQDKRFQESQEITGTLKQLFVGEVLRPIVEGKIVAESSIQTKLRKFVKIHSKDKNKAVAEQVKNLFGKNATQYGKVAEFFATDVHEAGIAIRNDIHEGKYTLNEIADHVDLTFANASWAAATEYRTLTDRAITAVQKRPWARAVANETTVGAITATAGFLLLRSSGRALSALTMGTGAGALIGGLERNRNLKRDMASHRADAEYNQTWPDTVKRRAKLDKYRYTELASAADMLEKDADRSTINGDSSSLETLISQQDSHDNRDALVARIAEIQERLRFSAKKRSGFIIYDDVRRVEQERLALIKGIARGKQKILDGLVAEGISQQQAKAHVNHMVAESAKTWKEHLTKDKKKQDRRFRGYRVGSSLTHAAIGGAIGFVSGAIAQEAVAGVMRLSGETVSPTILEKPFVNEEELTKQALEQYHTQSVSQAKDIWNSHETELDKRAGYAYDTRGSNGNELKLHTDKHGTGIDLNMQNMGWSSESGLKPPHLYVPDVQHTGNAAYAINLPGQEYNPVIAMADRSGTLHLDPANHNPVDIVTFANGKTMQVGEFSQQVLNPSAYASLPNGDIATEVNPQRRAVFAIGGNHGNMGEISAGRLVEQDGQTVWQSFATIFGTGKTPAAEKITVPTIQFEKPTEIPAIPLVVTPRRPLEPERKMHTP